MLIKARNLIFIFCGLLSFFSFQFANAEAVLLSDNESCSRALKLLQKKTFSPLFVEKECNFLKVGKNIVYLKYGEYKVFIVFESINNNNSYEKVRFLVNKTNSNIIYFDEIKELWPGKAVSRDWIFAIETKALLVPVYSLKLPDSPTGWSTGFPNCFIEWPSKECRR